MIADAGLGWDELHEQGTFATQPRRKGGDAELSVDEGGNPHQARWFDNGRGEFEMQGPAYHNFVKTGSPLDKAIHSGDADLAPYAYQLRQILDKALERNSTTPDKQQALALFKRTKNEYFNQKVITEAIVKDAKEGKRRGLIDASRLYDRLKTYGWDGGNPTTPLQQLASAGKTVVPPYRAGAFSAGHEAGSGRSFARAGGATLGGLVGAAGGLPGAAGGAAIGAAMGPYAVGKAVNSRLVQNYLKNQRSITAASRGPAEPRDLGEMVRSGARGAAIAGPAGHKRKQDDRPRIYEGE